MTRGRRPADPNRVFNNPEEWYEVRDCGYETPCWIWIRCKSRGKVAQYGTIKINGKMQRAPRIMYEHHKGAIPPSYVLDHLCRNTLCVNPDHLEAVPQRENIRRGRLSKLSREQVEKIKAAAFLGEFSNRELARRFGVSSVQVDRIVNGEQWADVIPERYLLADKVARLVLKHRRQWQAWEMGEGPGPAGGWLEKERAAVDEYEEAERRAQAEATA